MPNDPTPAPLTEAEIDVLDAPDFLDEIIAESEAHTPGFGAMVASAQARRPMGAEIRRLFAEAEMLRAKLARRRAGLELAARDYGAPPRAAALGGLPCRRCGVPADEQFDGCAGVTARMREMEAETAALRLERRAAASHADAWESRAADAEAAARALTARVDTITAELQLTIATLDVEQRTAATCERLAGDLADEVERLRARVREVEGERDEARADFAAGQRQHICMVDVLVAERDALADTVMNAYAVSGATPETIVRTRLPAVVAALVTRLAERDAEVSRLRALLLEAGEIVRDVSGRRLPARATGAEAADLHRRIGEALRGAGGEGG